MMKRRQFLGMLGLAVVAPALSSCGKGFEMWLLESVPLPPERGVNFGFEDVSNPAFDWQVMGRRLVDVGATAVSLGVGRVEWVAFPWQDHPEASAAAGNRDYVQRALDGLADRFRVSLTIDALVPDTISRNPGVAGEDVSGRRSTEFAAVHALRDGEVGEMLVELSATLASRYRPASIALTELMFDDYTFSDDDLAAYREFSGNDDWPRVDGRIDQQSPLLAQWRSEALSHLGGKIRRELPDSVRLDMDVRAAWDDPDSDRALSGHDYAQLLDSADRIAVWNYNAINDAPAKYSQQLAESLHRRFGDRYVLSTGLWGDDGAVVSPEDMALSLKYSAKGGAQAVSVTPASLMTPRHWELLAKTWNPQDQ